MENECESCGEYDTLFMHGLCFTCIGKLKAERERLRKDSVRLDWLLDDLQIDEFSGVCVHTLAYNMAIANGLREPAELEYRAANRMAIDEAMALQQTSDTAGVSDA